jgi:hypothetical protein
MGSFPSSEEEEGTGVGIRQEVKKSNSKGIPVHLASGLTWIQTKVDGSHFTTNSQENSSAGAKTKPYCSGRIYIIANEGVDSILLCIKW